MTIVISPLQKSWKERRSKVNRIQEEDPENPKRGITDYDL
jgi:hypothetical protein